MAKVRVAIIPVSLIVIGRLNFQDKFNLSIISFFRCYLFKYMGKIFL